MSEANPTQREVIDNLRIDVGIIKDQMGGLRESNKTIITKMDGFTFAKQTQVDGIILTVEKIENRTTILEQRIKPVEKIYYLVLGTLVTGIIGLGFWLLQKALQK